MLSFIVPEDRKIFLDSFTPFLTGKSDYHTAEYRVMTKTGEIMWISCHGKGLHDQAGNPLMIAGSLMDITEKKRIDEQMQQMLYYDMLTGLKNRHCFEKEMSEYLSRYPDATGSVLCVDIRQFQGIQRDLRPQLRQHHSAGVFPHFAAVHHRQPGPLPAGRGRIPHPSAPERPGGDSGKADPL